MLASLDLLWPRSSGANIIYSEVSSVNVREAKVEGGPRSRALSTRTDLKDLVQVIKDTATNVFILSLEDREPEPSPTRMVDKQLWQALKNGQMITFLIFDGDPVTGYLAGMDDETYFVLQPRGTEFFKKIIIQKHGTPQLEIHQDSTYHEAIPYFDEMEKIIAPFRTYVLHNHLGQQNRNGSRYARTQR